MTHCKDHRRHGNEDNVGKTSNDQKKLSRGPTVVVKVVDRENAGSPRCNEEHDEGEDHLEKHTRENVNLF